MRSRIGSGRTPSGLAVVEVFAVTLPERVDGSLAARDPHVGHDVVLQPNRLCAPHMPRARAKLHTYYDRGLIYRIVRTTALRLLTVNATIQHSVSPA